MALLLTNLKNIAPDVFDEDEVDDEDAEGEEEGEAADEADASRQRQAAAALLHDVGLLPGHAQLVSDSFLRFLVENFRFNRRRFVFDVRTDFFGSARR